MLILSRKQEESIVVGDDIVIKVIGIERGSVKLGFQAPPRTLILRAELREVVQSENKKASETESKNLESIDLSELRSHLVHKNLKK